MATVDRERNPIDLELALRIERDFRHVADNGAVTLVNGDAAAASLATPAGPGGTTKEK